MKKSVLILVAAVLLPALPGITYSQYNQDAHNHENAKDVYQCSMHPEVKSDMPGTCPICQMKLVKVAQTNGVRDNKVGSKESGTTQPKERKVKFYRHPMNPSILSDHPAKDEMGMDYVPVFEDGSTGSGTSNVSGRAKLTISQDQQQNMKLKLALVQFRNLGKELRVPGRVIHQDSVALQVFEKDLGWIQTGNDVQIEVASFPGKMFSGKVTSIDAVLDPTTRTARVVTSIVSGRGTLRIESSVVAKIAGSPRKRLTVPEAAVFSTGAEDYVFISEDGFTFVPRRVSLGLKSSGMYEIVDGLKEGDQISEGPNFLIDSESRVQFSVREASGKK